MSASRSRILSVTLFGASTLLLLGGFVPDARAGCNAIPVIARTYQSEKGSVLQRLALPDGVVRIVLRSCDSAPNAFPEGDVNVTLQIHPPSGSLPGVQVLTATVRNCDASGNCPVCPTGGSCNTLDTRIPNATATAGPAEIIVSQKSDPSVVLARIYKLYQPNRNCLTSQPDEVFGTFTVLPEPNSFKTLTDTTNDAALNMTLDGYGNLLLPLTHDRTGPDAVYEKGRGRFYRTQLSFTSISSAFAGAAKFPVGGDRLVRSFTTDGRSIAPVFSFDSDGNFFGIADIDNSVLRFLAKDNDGNEIFDVDHRIDGNTGIVRAKRKAPIGQRYEAETCHDPVPFDGLRMTREVLSFAHAAAGSGRDVQVHNLEVAGETCDTNTGTPTTDPPSIEAGGPLTVIVEDQSDGLVVFDENGSRLDDSSCDPLEIDTGGNVNDGRVFAVERAAGEWVVYFITADPPNELWVFDRQQTRGSKCRSLGSADRVAVWHDHALLRDPIGGDLTAYAYDPTTGSGTATSLGVTGELLAVGRGAAAATTPKGAAAGLTKVWIWPDGASAPTLPAQDAGARADQLDATYAASNGTTWVIIITPEASQMADVNQDGDQLDRVLRLYEPATGTLLTPARPAGPFKGSTAEEFVVDRELVALRAVEADEGTAGTDLNDDGDECDHVLHVVDLRNRTATSAPTVENSGQQALGPAEVPWEDVDWRTAYRVAGRNVLFLTDECKQGGTVALGCTGQAGCNAMGTDLDLDGDAGDVVLQAFNVGAGIVQPIPLTPDAKAPILTTTSTSDAELELGLLTPGANALAIGDVDADGMLDQSDNCAAERNVDQADDDLDGLGDRACDASYCDSFVPILKPQPVPPGCLPGVGDAAHQYLLARSDATQDCLNALIDGTQQGDPRQLCRGYFVGSVENRPTLPTGDQAGVMEAERALRTAVMSCDTVRILHPGIQARTIAERVVRAHGESVVAGARVSYGAAAAQADPAVRTCQMEMATATASFLTVASAAMQSCVAANRERGDLGAFCMGRITGDKVDMPLHGPTRSALGAAAGRLDEALQSHCGGGRLAPLDACADDVVGVRSCLLCTNWRRAVDTVASIHGSIDPGPVQVAASP